MPFLGVVHANARQILASYIPALPEHVNVVCSGNFSLETTLRMNGYKGRLTGCDVSLYTCSLGAYLAGIEIPLTLNADKFPELAPLAECLGDQEGRTAAVAVALDALEWQKQQNRFAARNYAAYCRRLVELVNKTRVKLQKKKAEVGLAEFHPMDGWERVGTIPIDGTHAILTFPPTYSGGYEKLYAKLNELFTWDAPTYRELTSGAEFAKRIVDSGCPWLIGAEKPTPDLEAVVGKPISIAPRGTGISISFYSNIPELRARVMRRTINVREPDFARLTDHDAITAESRISIHRIEFPEANYIRQIYCSVEVGQASAQYSYAVACDGKLIGLLLFQDYAKAAFKIEGSKGGDMVYMMADLAISTRRYPRLSKLVLMAAISAEMQEDLQRRAIKEVNFNVTTAFSKNPASMKYRGLFKVLTRKQEPNQIYKINYVAPMGKFTLQEALAQWLKKHSAPTSSEPSTTISPDSAG